MIFLFNFYNFIYSIGFTQGFIFNFVFLFLSVSVDFECHGFSELA